MLSSPALGVLSGYPSGPSAAAAGTHRPPVFGQRPARGAHGRRDPLGGMLARTDVALPSLIDVAGECRTFLHSPAGGVPGQVGSEACNPSSGVLSSSERGIWRLPR